VLNCGFGIANKQAENTDCLGCVLQVLLLMMEMIASRMAGLGAGAAEPEDNTVCNEMKKTEYASDPSQVRGSSFKN